MNKGSQGDSLGMGACRGINQTGFSLIEVLIAVGLSAFIIGLSATPIVQMKTVEKRVEFQTMLASAHQLALLKSRNGTFLKANLGVAPDTTHGLVPGSRGDKCFGGRGTGCLDYQIANWKSLDSFNLDMNGFSATSAVSMRVTCESNLKCNQVEVKVETQPTDPTHAIYVKTLKAQFTIPAAALSSRQEIDFSQCFDAATGNWKVITGINYQTLKAECTAFGNNTCNNMGGTGPILTFGPNVNPNDPTNCQPPVNRSCTEGLATFGLINGQAECSTTPVCTDPFSTTCNPAPTLPPCVPNWSPADGSGVCLGQTVVQTDLNGCSPPRPLVGTNPALCAVNSCTYTGTLKWPDPVTGPCSNSSANLTAAPNSTSSVVNDNLNFHGTLTATCKDVPPAAPDFDWAAARSASSCVPIQCQGVPASLQWSATGLFDGSPGPWPCSGPLTPSGTLNASQTASATNTAATATAGSVQASCVDNGPVGAPRSGSINYSAISCTPKVAGGCGSTNGGVLLQRCQHGTMANNCMGAGPEPYCGCPDGHWAWLYGAPDPIPASPFYVPGGVAALNCAAAKVDGVCGSAAGTAAPTAPTSGLCNAGNPSAVSGVGPFTWTCAGTGGGADASCATTPPACHPNGWQTFMSSDHEGELCVSEGGSDLGPTPNVNCCTGYDVALYSGMDTVGSSGGCWRVCGNNIPPNIKGTWQNVGSGSCASLQVCTDQGGTPNAGPVGSECRMATDGGKTCKGNPVDAINCMELECKP